MYYRAKRGSIEDESGKQLAVVLPSNCSKKLSYQLAKWAVEKLNQDVLAKEIQKAQKERAENDQ